MNERRKPTPEEVRTPAYQARVYVDNLTRSGMDPAQIHATLMTDRKSMRPRAKTVDRSGRIWQDHFGICVELILSRQFEYEVPEGGSVRDSRFVPLERLTDKAPES